MFRVVFATFDTIRILKLDFHDAFSRFHFYNRRYQSIDVSKNDADA